MRIQFTKMHGCGNDYIYVNAMQQHIADPAAAAVQWSDRHKGIGSDGLVLIDKADIPEADYSMRIFNADGSEAMMCGNASRCIGKYLYERGITDKTEIRLLTLAGIKILSLHITDGIVESVTVDMGEPVFEDENLFRPDIAKGESTPLDLEAPLAPWREVRGEAGGESSFVSMGNPHYVIFTDDVDQVGKTGRMLEYHPAFPQRCNIEFARINPDGTIRTRVWERGSGITMACGTGACATAVAAVLCKGAERRSTIVMDGGPITIEWCKDNHSEAGHFYKKNHVYMTGPASFVFDGETEII